MQGIANQMEPPIDLKTGFNRHEKRLQRVKKHAFLFETIKLNRLKHFKMWCNNLVWWCKKAPLQGSDGDESY